MGVMPYSQKYLKTLIRARIAQVIFSGKPKIEMNSFQKQNMDILCILYEKY